MLGPARSARLPRFPRGSGGPLSSEWEAYVPYEATPENEARVRHEVEWSDLATSGRLAVEERTVARPSANRELAKGPLIEQLLVQEELLDRALTVYERVVAAGVWPSVTPAVTRAAVESSGGATEATEGAQLVSLSRARASVSGGSSASASASADALPVAV